MSATLSVWSALQVLRSGETRAWGSLSQAVEATLTDGTIFADATLTLGASGSTTLWWWSNQPIAWQYAVIVPSVAGYLSIMYDKPVSSIDRTPLGTHRNWSTIGLSANFEYKMTASLGLTNPSPADFASDDGAGTPTLWADPGTVSGYVYRLAIKNAGAVAGLVRCVLIG